MMPWLESSLKVFEPISLSEMENVKLMDRLDTKFTFHSNRLAAILEAMRPDYCVLEVKGVRASRYETLYFDTGNLDLYARHHSGKFSRHKIRYRRYLDSELCFFEVKAKNNKGRTIKKRIQRQEIPSDIETESEQLLRTETPFAARDLKPAIWVNFTRLTFVSKASPERLTIDLQLSYKRGSAEVSFPQLVIAEVKQERSSSPSPFLKLMRDLRISREA